MQHLPSWRYRCARVVARIDLGVLRRARRAARRNRSGSTLAEILVALLLVGVAVLSLGGAASAASAMLRGAALEQGAVLAAEGVLDSLAAEPDVKSAAVTRGPWTMEWIVADSAGSRLIELEVRYDDGGTERHLRFGLRSARRPTYKPEPI